MAVISAQTLADDDLTARNSWEERDRIGLADNESALSTDGVVTVRLAPVSWTTVLLGQPEALIATYVTCMIYWQKHRQSGW